MIFATIWKNNAACGSFCMNEKLKFKNSCIKEVVHWQDANSHHVNAFQCVAHPLLEEHWKKCIQIFILQMWLIVFVFRTIQIFVHTPLHYKHWYQNGFQDEHVKIIQTHTNAFNCAQMLHIQSQNFKLCIAMLASA